MKQTKLIPLLGLGFTLFLSKPHMIYGNATFGGGDGTENNPYRLSTPEHLTELQVAVDGGNAFSGKHFILTNDIDFTGYDNDSNPDNGNFSPIGELNERIQRSFSGDLDGQGYAIENLSAKSSVGDAVGLFAFIDNANIENIHLKQIKIESQIFGGITGYSNMSRISRVMVTGELVGDIGGGLVTLSEYSTIENSSFEGKVEGRIQVGGLLGGASSTTLQNSQVNANVIGESFVGGVIGTMGGTTMLKIDFEGNVVGYDSVGGLVGVVRMGSILDSHVKGVVNGTTTIGGLVGMTEGVIELSETSFQGDVIGEEFAGGLIGLTMGLTSVQASFANGNIKGTSTAGGLVGYQEGASDLSNVYVLGTVTGETNVGGMIGISHKAPEQSIDLDLSLSIQNSYHQAIVTGDFNVGQLIGQVGGGEDMMGVDVEGYVAFKNVYLSEELNQGMPIVGSIFMGEVLNEDILFLTTNQMTQGNTKNTMSALDFEDIWTTTSTTPMFRWQKDLISANEGEVQINGSVETMIADVTIPSVSPDLVINPNLSEGLVAPEFSVSNDSVSPIKLELKTFEQVTDTFNDVLPSKYDSWEGLNKTQSQDIALGLVAKEGEGWQQLTTPTSYVANHTDHEIGIIKPTSSVDFSFNVKHGTSFSEAKTVQYKMVFVFDLLN